MTTREAVEALGRELLAYLPQPKQPSGLLQSTPGPAPAERTPCPACGSRGRVTAPGRPCASCPPRRSPTRDAPPWNTKHGCIPCLGCDGTGWRKARAGEEAVDEYVSAPDAAPWEEVEDLGRRLERTERLLKLWLDPGSVGYRWEETRERIWSSGSFAELDAALRRLHATHPRRFSLWWRVIVLQEPLQLSESAHAAVAETSDMLAAMMPRPIRVPAWLRPDRKAKLAKTSLWRGQTQAHATARADRNATIVYQAQVLGWSPAKIAAHHGLTKRRVNQLLAEQKEGQHVEAQATALA